MTQKLRWPPPTSHLYHLYHLGHLHLGLPFDGLPIHSCDFITSCYGAI